MKESILLQRPKKSIETNDKDYFSSCFEAASREYCIGDEALRHSPEELRAGFDRIIKVYKIDQKGFNELLQKPEKALLLLCIVDLITPPISQFAREYIGDLGLIIPFIFTTKGSRKIKHYSELLKGYKKRPKITQLDTTDHNLYSYTNLLHMASKGAIKRPGSSLNKLRFGEDNNLSRAISTCLGNSAEFKEQIATLASLYDIEVEKINTPPIAVLKFPTSSELKLQKISPDNRSQTKDLTINIGAYHQIGKGILLPHIAGLILLGSDMNQFGSAIERGLKMYKEPAISMQSFVELSKYYQKHFWYVLFHEISHHFHNQKQNIVNKTFSEHQFGKVGLEVGVDNAAAQTLNTYGRGYAKERVVLENFCSKLDIACSNPNILIEANYNKDLRSDLLSDILKVYGAEGIVSFICSKLKGDYDTNPSIIGVPLTALEDCKAKIS